VGDEVDDEVEDSVEEVEVDDDGEVEDVVVDDDAFGFNPSARAFSRACTNCVFSKNAFVEIP
jgi:hypothetical protein